MTSQESNRAGAAQIQPLQAGMPSTWSCLLGLFGGLALGALIQTGFLELLGPLATLVEPLGSLWSRALEMVAFPLAVISLLAAVVAARSRSVGRVVVTSAGLLVLFLVLGAIFAFAVTIPLLPMIPISSESLPSEPSVGVDSIASETSEPVSFGDWLIDLVPRNLLQAASEGNLAQVEVLPIRRTERRQN